MSAESPAASRPPQSNSAKSDSGPEEPDSETRREKSLDELPDPEEKLQEFLEEFGDRAHVPLSKEHGRGLRPECEHEEHEMRERVTEEGGTERVEQLVTREAAPWWKAVGEMLEWHEEYHKSTLRLEYGTESDPTHTLLDVDLDNSWMAAYQDKERARLKALERETCGFETCGECDTRYCTEPGEHETEYVPGEFEEPVVVLTGRTASGAGRPPVDHAREIADAWTSGGVRRSLRYEMDKLGLEGHEWVRWTQGEPHPGDGGNQGYHHTHDIIILDGAAADGEITPATFRPVIESHVEKCEHAGGEAHDLDKSAGEWERGEVDTVTVKEVDGEIEESVASYAAAYLANDKKDLLERPPEYLAWAASMWATDTRKATGTDSRTHAIEADKCRHKHHEGEQSVAHGEQVTYSTKRDYKAECVMCGSPWGVEQAETLVAAKRTAGPEVAADGGAVPERETGEQSAEEELRERWQSARSAARVGGETAEREVVGRAEGRELEGRELALGGGEDYCSACGEVEPSGECRASAYRDAEYEGRCPLPPEHFGEHTVVEGEDNAEKTVTTGSEEYRGDGHVPFEYESEPDGETVGVGFDRPPKWRAKAIIRDGEELAASGGATEKRPLVLPSAPAQVAAMSARDGAKLECRECGAWCDSPAEYAGHECEGRVYVRWLPATSPPAEETTLGYEEFVEAVPARLLEEHDHADGEHDRADGEHELGEPVRRYCENNPAAAVPEVLGRFDLPPGMAGDVRDVLDSHAPDDPTKTGEGA
jgi:hypothetical protein